VSDTPRCATKSPLPGAILPENSARFGLMPLSTTAMVTPRPVPPAL
jgi:hypothetical protein